MSETVERPQATFTSMENSTKEDWDIIGAEAAGYSAELPDRVLDHLRLLAGDTGGFPVTRLEHSLQTATRCFEAGKDEEYIVCALLHDIGDTLGSYNHADIAASILEPFISEENHWIVAHHGIFQGYYFFQHIGLDRNLREQYRDNPYFDACAEFCRYDQAAFDPEFVSKPLEFFEPMVRRVMAKPKKSIYKRRNDAA